MVQEGQEQEQAQAQAAALPKMELYGFLFILIQPLVINSDLDGGPISSDFLQGSGNNVLSGD